VGYDDCVSNIGSVTISNVDADDKNISIIVNSVRNIGQ
jgi:hypothetical protein